MTLSDTVSFGPAAIPLILIIAAVISAGAYFTGSIILKKAGTRSRMFSDLLFTPVLPFLISWKFSLLITDTRDVFADPRLLLYSSGSLINVLLGILAAGIWFLYSFKKRKPSKEIRTALTGSLITVLLLSLTAGTLMHLTNSHDASDNHLPIIDFTGQDGSEWNITVAEGKTTVLNFWASWCPPCKAEMPMLERLQQDPGLKNVVFFAVNVAVSEKRPDDGLHWMDSNDIELPLLFDYSGQGMQLYEISALPTTLVIDGEGRLVEKKIGAVSRSWILSAVREAQR